jgi:hypothetical protein
VCCLWISLYTAERIDTRILDAPARFAAAFNNTAFQAISHSDATLTAGEDVGSPQEAAAKVERQRNDVVDELADAMRDGLKVDARSAEQ